MEPDSRAAEGGGKRPRGISRVFVPKQKKEGEALGDHGADQLPPESRNQWKTAVGMRPTCLALAYKLVPFHEAEDVWQETKFSVWSRLKTGPVDNINAYVKTACRNKAIDRLRAKQKRAEVFFGDDTDRYEKAGPVFDENVDAEIREMVEIIRPLMTEYEALIFVLRCQFNWTTRMVAESLGVTEDAVKTAYKVGKKKARGTGLDRGPLFRVLNPD
ncbi:sigma-70 family RNA polymerase sigma factor [Streptomyces sp. NPDC014983]|uniref:sigma-70 family RNA polymerase sigma factor n=1 Tax=Streptomyces sp. NPDC014983 TaxID=3364933 RepID=UPI0037022E36